MLGPTIFDKRLEPVTGKAVEVRKGQVLTIRTPYGGQCVDFNAFNLHDYKEYMSVGHSRRQGMHLVEGDTLITNSPRCNALLHFLEMPETCVTDTLAARCNAVLFEWRVDFEFHTNCQDTLAEAIREYRLTPDDVHDSCNIFMNTVWEDAIEGGTFSSNMNSSQPGDTVRLLACMDTLAVPIVCGSGDIGPVSNYMFKPIDIELHEATEESLAYAERVTEVFAAPRTRVSPEVYKVKEILATRELEVDTSYSPDYLRHPMGMSDLEIPTHDGLTARLNELVQTAAANDLQDAIRRTVMPAVVQTLAGESPERRNDQDRRRIAAGRR